jgi:hypothetical protein
MQLSLDKRGATSSFATRYSIASKMAKNWFSNRSIA